MFNMELDISVDNYECHPNSVQERIISTDYSKKDKKIFTAAELANIFQNLPQEFRNAPVIVRESDKGWGRMRFSQNS